MYKDVLTYIDLGQPKLWGASLPAAIELARSNKANLHVLTHVPDFSMSIVEQFFPADFDNKKVAESVLKQLEEFVNENVPADVNSRAIVAAGKVRDVILNVSTKIDADVIVLAPARAPHKHNALGVTASYVTRHAECSVLIVR